MPDNRAKPQATDGTEIVNGLALEHLRINWEAPQHVLFVGPITRNVKFRLSQNKPGCKQQPSLCILQHICGIFVQNK